MSTKTNLDGRKKISKTDRTGEYEVELDGVVVGYVKKYRERTRVMSGAILVGHTESTRWQYEDITTVSGRRSFPARGYATRGDAIYAMTYQIDSVRRYEELAVAKKAEDDRKKRLNAQMLAQAEIRENVYKYAAALDVDVETIQNRLDEIVESTFDAIDGVVDEIKGY